MPSSTARTLLAAAVGAALATGGVLALDGGSGSSTGAQSAAGSSPSASSSSPSGAAAGSSSGVRVATSPISGHKLSASEIYAQDSPGVVTITADGEDGEDEGTGIVLDQQGDIVTNDHVVSDAQQIEVSFGTSTATHAATLVGAAPDSDLAVIKIDPSGLTLHPLTFGDSGKVVVGQSVYAIGNPYGLSQTLTTGIISATGRTIQAPDGANIDGAIQTDAALNPGNSGGPLINDDGHVIGINSQIASDEASIGGQPGSTGVGFAIASDTVSKVVKEIETSGTQASSVPAQPSESPYGEEGGGGSPYGGAGGYGYGYGGSPYGGMPGMPGIEITPGGGIEITPGG